ncbi:MAG: cyclic nucleotide-binding domain-containing protein [Nitratireductor sp.]|nr:cyclic nucleotide-binding domain-containing protein [Nitratireductor sp.]MCB1456781.1 cyclic nucleotide-binding domain-containing protein [Nitratireductor sp.]MCB1459770.1 cyclic nucleotide-binding domain-containing protein [Nitratireductor sp.]
MRLESDIELLMRVDLFQGFQPEQLRLVAFGAERERMHKDEVLYRDGEEADGGYVVVRGQIDLMVFRGRREIILDSCLEGSLLGELALLTANRRISNAVAAVETEVLHVPRRLFHRMLNEYPETAALMYRRLSQSVSRTMENLARVHGKLENIPKLDIPAETHPELEGFTIPQPGGETD